jgi:hypothetical protein
VRCDAVRRAPTAGPEDRHAAGSRPIRANGPPRRLVRDKAAQLVLRPESAKRSGPACKANRRLSAERRCPSGLDRVHDRDPLRSAAKVALDRGRSASPCDRSSRPPRSGRGYAARAWEGPSFPCRAPGSHQLRGGRLFGLRASLRRGCDGICRRRAATTGRKQRTQSCDRSAHVGASAVPQIGDFRSECFAATLSEESPAGERSSRFFAASTTSGRYWARTSDLRLVEAALSQLS